MNQKVDPKVLAALLKKPEGEAGIKVAEKLNETNLHITSFTYECMNPQEGQNILEIGFGNGKLMPELFNGLQNLTITGIDFSEDMIREGNKYLKNWIDKGQIKILNASVENMPFEDQHFHAVCTINTLYFWPNPVDNALEIKRVLKPGGKLFISIRPKQVAEKLPATQHGFQLYEEEEAIELLIKAGFENVNIKRQLDPPIEYNGSTERFESLVIIGTKPI